MYESTLHSVHSSPLTMKSAPPALSISEPFFESMLHNVRVHSSPLHIPSARLVNQRALLLELDVVKDARLGARLLARRHGAGDAHAAPAAGTAETGALVRQDLVGRVQARPRDVRRALLSAGVGQ